MNKTAIRLLVLAMFATAAAVVPTLGPAKAATDGSTKKKHKRVTPAGSEAQAPRTSSQYPPNMADDPNRKISY
jgi:hypothetical protein